MAEFETCLDASQLLPAEEWRAFLQTLPAGTPPQEPKDVARGLLRAGKLTKFQATELLHGRVRHLAFGEYVLLEPLGKGGMAVVYKAQHRRMKRLAAIKMLAPASLGDEDAVARFHREVEAAAVNADTDPKTLGLAPTLSKPALDAPDALPGPVAVASPADPTPGSLSLGERARVSPRTMRARRAHLVQCYVQYAFGLKLYTTLEDKRVDPDLRRHPAEVGTGPF